MTDFFALLDQPRAPWLDPAALKEAFHRKTLEHHPDANIGSSESRFAEINEACQVLQDPKRRLQHLLVLENSPPSSVGRTIPQELQELFLQIGALNQRVNAFFEKSQSSSNALGRSLLKPESIALQKEADGLRARLRNLNDAAIGQLSGLNSAWQRDRASALTALTDLYFQFAYLGRWITQLDELAFQLSS